MIIIEHCVSYTLNGKMMEKEFPEEKLAEAQAFAASVNGTLESVEEQIADTPTQVQTIGEKFDDGYFDETLQVRLKTTKDAQQKFTGAVAMINSALLVGAMTANSSAEFGDYYDQKHTVTVGEFIGLMLRYGQFLTAQVLG